ncbi:MAG: type IV secretion system DotC family protein [Micavibrio sp.]
MKSKILAVWTVSLLMISAPAMALEVASDEAPVPPPISVLENIEGTTLPELKGDYDDNKGLPFNLREDALKEAAWSYGARGGLAVRTYQIRKELESRAPQLDKTFDFRQLLLPAPSGLMIEPPIISESVNALLIDGRGQEAAVSDRVYEIIRNARIVSSSRHWRNYLERDWGDVAPPSDILRPANKEEREKWIIWVREGWAKGIEQADEIFSDDLNQLSADYNGMVRYRLLLAQGMISPPHALQVDRGVTGSGNRLRVGDRAVQITGKPEFVPGTERWQPANR